MYERWCVKCNRSRPIKGGLVVIGRKFQCAECRPQKQVVK